MHEFDEVWRTDTGRRQARYWEFALRSRGVSGIDADDILAQARRKVVEARCGRQDPVARPAAYFRTAVDNVGRSLLRSARPTVALELAGPLLRHDPRFHEVHRRMAHQAALQFLEAERTEIWRRAVRRLGAPERAEALWTAAVAATGQLLVGDGSRSVSEIVGGALGHDPYWRTGGGPDGAVVSPGTLGKRVDRARCWVSYVVLEAVHAVSETGTCADPLVEAVTRLHWTDGRRRLGGVTDSALRGRLEAHLAQLDDDLQTAGVRHRTRPES